MKPAYLVVLITAFTGVCGCAKNYSLAPPTDSEQITVTIKVPDQLKAESMRVMYRSKICTFINHTASGEPYKRDGYRKIDLQPVRRGESDLYEAKLAVDGGGACQWRLSNVTFGVVYEDPTIFGENVTFGAGGGVVVVFDNNNSPRGGTGKKVDGDLRIRKDYYPWVDEDFLGEYQKTINLVGEVETYFEYQALQARNLYFEPVLHTDFVLYSAGPKEKRKGNYPVFVFPDGSVVDDDRPNSKFLKLQAIRKFSEAIK